MNMISRRNFMKAAGVLGASVAATAVLGGCSLSTKTVKVNFVAPEKLEKYNATYDAEVLSTADVINTEYFKDAIPKGFTVTGKAYAITADEAGFHTTINMVVDAAYQVVTVEYFDEASDSLKPIKTDYVVTKKAEGAITAADVAVPTGYEASPEVNTYAIDYGNVNPLVTIYCAKKAVNA